MAKAGDGWRGLYIGVRKNSSGEIAKPRISVLCVVCACWFESDISSYILHALLAMPVTIILYP